MTKKVFDSFSEEVWDTLSRIDVVEHTDKLPKTGKRPEISYLSWSMAWILCKRNFPATTYSHREDIVHPDGTVEVEVDVVISKDGGEVQFTNARLGVMDNYFNPITHPTARQINDTRQRTLVKALAFSGLGLDLWADSRMPVGKMDDPISYEQLEILTDLIAKTETNEHTFLRWCDCESLDQLPVERYGSALGLLEAKLRKMGAKK